MATPTPKLKKEVTPPARIEEESAKKQGKTAFESVKSEPTPTEKINIEATPMKVKKEGTVSKEEVKEPEKVQKSKEVPNVSEKLATATPSAKSEEPKIVNAFKANELQNPEEETLESGGVIDVPIVTPKSSIDTATPTKESFAKEVKTPQKINDQEAILKIHAATPSNKSKETQNAIKNNLQQATPSIPEKLSPAASSPTKSLENRREVKKILENKSNIMEKASQRASALNMTRLCPTLVFATGSSTLRSVRLQELNVTLVILATTAEELESGKATPTLEGVACRQIVLDLNRDNEDKIESYLHNAADWIHDLPKGVAMVHAPESGAFKKGANLQDTRRGENFAAALCAAYLVKYKEMSAQEAVETIK